MQFIPGDEQFEGSGFICTTCGRGYKMPARIATVSAQPVAATQSLSGGFNTDIIDALVGEACPLQLQALTEVLSSHCLWKLAVLAFL